MSNLIFIIYSEYMIDYQRCFIENIKLYRKKLGFSQSYLAELCDVSTGTIGNIECGLTKPSFDLIIVLAEKLNTTPETLFHTDSSTAVSLEDQMITKQQLLKLQQSIISAVNNSFGSLSV